ncbi:EF-hand, partial [Ramicandelaber brevisporus]
MSVDPQQQQRLWTFYNQVGGGDSVSAHELQRCLVNADGTQFSLETIHLLISLNDRNGTGLLEFNEFLSVYSYIDQWKRCFMQADRDRSGYVSHNELQGALRQFGFNVNPQFVTNALRKIEVQNGNAKHLDISRGATLDSFIRICVTVKKLTEAFRFFDGQDGNPDGTATMTYDQFLDISLKTR